MGHIHIIGIPYSLKFSRLKIFADFTGLSKAMKIFSRESFSSSLIQGMGGRLEARWQKFIRKNLFLSRIGQKHEIFTPQILGYTVAPM